ncbi:unnamed protein product, partial [Brenthis ino]
MTLAAIFLSVGCQLRCEEECVKFVAECIFCDFKMPLSQAEKSRRYREKLKRTNPDKYQEIKKKNKSRAIKAYQNKKKSITDSQKAEHRLSQNKNSIRQTVHIIQSTSNEQPANMEHQDITEDRSNEVNLETQSMLAVQVPDRLEQNDTESRSNTYLNKTVIRNIQRNIEKKMRRENNQLREYVDKLIRDYKSVQRDMRKLKSDFRDLAKKVHHNEAEIVNHTIVQEQENTAYKRSENFVNEHLTNVATPEKEVIKKKILEYNVLTDSIKSKFKICQNQDKNTFKDVVDDPIVKKYKLKTSLTKSLGLKNSLKRHEETKTKTHDLIETIRRFYERDDVSRASAGKKECRTYRKCKMQVRYLLDKLETLYKKYVSEVGSISYSTFKKYRPFYVISPNLKNLKTCACLKHCNMQFILNALKSAGILESNDINTILDKLVCDPDFKQCMYGECSVCKDNAVQVNKEENLVINWFSWKVKEHEYDEKGERKKTKRMAKTENKGTLKDLVDLFNKEMNKFKIHVYNMRHQQRQYKLCIENLDYNECALHIDFSENWLCKHHEEIQAMHFGASKNQITLHTGVLYIKNEKPLSFCTISAENCHTPEAIWAHLDPASHGKGAADGVGGTIKRTLDFKVSHGTDIPDAQTAFNVLQETATSIKTFFIRPESIQTLNTNIASKLTAIRNTLKIHQIVSHAKFILKYRILSCFCQNLKGKCECFEPKIHSFEFQTEFTIDGNRKDESYTRLELDETTGELKQVREQKNDSLEIKGNEMCSEEQLFHWTQDSFLSDNMDIDETNIDFDILNDSGILNAIECEGNDTAENQKYVEKDNEVTIYNPDSLKMFCNQVINSHFGISNQNTETQLSEVCVLNKISKNDSQNLSFYNDLPTCLQPVIPSSKISANESKVSVGCSKLIIHSNIKVDSEVKKNNIRKILKGAKVIKQSALNMEIVPKKVKNVKQNNALSQIDTLNEHASTSKEAGSKRKRKNVTTERTITCIKKGKKNINNRQKSKSSKHAVKKKKIATYIETSSENSDIISLADTDKSEYETLNEYITCLEDQEGKENLEPAIPFGISDIDYCTVDFLKKDDWIVAKFATKKSLKHFVGRVLSIKDNIPTVKFVRNVKNLKDSKGLIFTYPQVDDIYEMQLGDVIKVLPQPNISRRGQIIFDTDISYYNIQ